MYDDGIVDYSCKCRNGATLCSHVKVLLTILCWVPDRDLLSSTTFESYWKGGAGAHVLEKKMVKMVDMPRMRRIKKAELLAAQSESSSTDVEVPAPAAAAAPSAPADGAADPGATTSTVEASRNELIKACAAVLDKEAIDFQRLAEIDKALGWPVFCRSGDSA